ncbi:MAG TPA: hypothetical protein V6D28_29745 [Leptolyngbyaceae cyanobacterium]
MAVLILSERLPNPSGEGIQGVVVRPVREKPYETVRSDKYCICL